ncbi:hypothetical protein CL616_05265 [archaeon]|nr:hypothetical protein [archaeon]
MARDRIRIENDDDSSNSTETTSQDKNFELRDGKYTLNIEFHKKDGSVATIPNIEIDMDSIGSGVGGSSLFFTKSPDAETFDPKVKVRFGWRVKKPDAVRLYITDDEDNDKQSLLIDVDPYADEVEIDLSAYDKNKEYWLFLHNLDKNTHVEVGSSAKSNPFELVSYDLHILAAPSGDIAENERKPIQWKSDSGVYPLKLEIFVSEAKDGTKPFIPIHNRTHTPGNTIFYWKAEDTPAVEKGKAYWVGIRPLDNSNGVIANAPVTFWDRQFIVKKKVESSFKVTHSAKNIVGPGEGITVTAEYIGERPPQIKFYVTDKALGFNTAGKMPFAGPGDTLVGGTNVVFTDRLSMGSYQFIAVGCDANGDELSPEVKGISLPFTVQEVSAGYSLIFVKPPSSVNLGERLKAKWKYERVKGWAAPQGVEWFLTKSREEDYDSKSYIRLGSWRAWNEEGIVDSSSIASGDWLMGIVGLDANGDHLRSTRTFVPLEVLSSKDYTLEFVDPRGPPGYEVVEYEERKPVTLRWKRLREKPDKVNVYISDGTNEFLIPGFPLDFNLGVKWLVDLSNSEFQLNQNLHFIVEPVMGNVAMRNMANFSGDFKVVPAEVKYDLKFTKEPDKKEYFEGELVRVEFSCNPPASDLALWIGNKDIWTMGDWVPIENNQGSWIVDLGMFDDKEELVFVLMAGKQRDESYKFVEYSNSFKINKRVKYTIAVSKLSKNVYEEGEEIYVRWEVSPTMIPGGVNLYVETEEGTYNEPIEFKLPERNGNSTEWNAVISDEFPENTPLKFLVQAKNPIMVGEEGILPKAESNVFTVKKKEEALKKLRIRNKKRVYEVKQGGDLNLILVLETEDGKDYVYPDMAVGSDLHTLGIFEGDSGDRVIGGGGVVEYHLSVKEDIKPEKYKVNFVFFDTKNPEEARGTDIIKIRVLPKEEKKEESDAELMLTVKGNVLSGDMVKGSNFSGNSYDISLLDRDSLTFTIKNNGKSGKLFCDVSIPQGRFKDDLKYTDFDIKNFKLGPQKEVKGTFRILQRDNIKDDILDLIFTASTKKEIPYGEFYAHFRIRIRQN